MSIQSVLIYVRKAKAAILQAEDELGEAMKSLGIRPETQPKPPGRPLGSKNRPRTFDVAPGSTQDEAKAG